MQEALPRGLRQSVNKQSVSESMFDMDLSVGGHKHLKPAEACNGQNSVHDWGERAATLSDQSTADQGISRRFNLCSPVIFGINGFACLGPGLTISLPLTPTVLELSQSQNEGTIGICVLYRSRLRSSKIRIVDTRGKYMSKAG